MRILVQTDRVIQVLQAKRHPVDLTIQIFDPVNVFFAATRFELERLDAAGTPIGGFSLNNINTPFTMESLSGDLWARAGIQTEIEVFEAEQ